MYNRTFFAVTGMLALRAARDATVHLDTVPIPDIGPDDVLIRVASAGLAPGMMALLAIGAFRHLPTTVGHEAAGTVEAVGDYVDRGLIGQRVRVHPMLSCRSCTHCRSDREQMCRDAAMLGHAAFGSGQLQLYARYHDGGLAEYVRVPHWLVDVLPDNVSFDVAAKVWDLGNAVRALKQAELSVGDTLVITAATGTMGTATIKLAHFFGAGRLILVGRSEERLAAVLPLAAVPVETIALESLDEDWSTTQGLSTRIREVIPGGADAAIDYIKDGAATSQALAGLATGGTLVHMGGNLAAIPFPPAMMMLNMWRIIGTRACTRTDTDEVLRLLAQGAVQADDLITHRFALGDVQNGIAQMQERSEHLWMAIVNP
ncbi:zinc-dependent alcohol dehydrogenase [Mycobacterium deserti]|uniref:Alcohol dehydrogenase catalytic domain-containing protein n=1 Tax=Mycobacterium deserti TaxID=2978347 RepID=A0ABT2MH95_9MYCO|nr:alcohol dehydrogenase catalytic domain-containing protein [Mycobacterium deserti]MCT7660745.1 alcohol dehydrogenase catalytic domain-containing protein [Mycobacterium deserti]